MAVTAKPEIIPPHAKGGRQAFSDENLDLLSHLLDDFIRIPGTPIRFGLDGIVGFLPGVGDVLGGLASSIIILAAWSRGVAPSVLLRMVLNVAIETAAGSVPVLGNLFDIGWRANRRNYALLMQAVHSSANAASGQYGVGTSTPAKAKGRNWLLMAGVCLLLAVLVAIPMLLAGWLLVYLTHALGHLHSAIPPGSR